MTATKSMQDYIDMGLETYLTERVQDQENWMEGKSGSCKIIIKEGN